MLTLLAAHRLNVSGQPRYTVRPTLHLPTRRRRHLSPRDHVLPQPYVAQQAFRTIMRHSLPKQDQPKTHDSSVRNPGPDPQEPVAS